jgi:hypothetical protein
MGHGGTGPRSHVLIELSVSGGRRVAVGTRPRSVRTAGESVPGAGRRRLPPVGRGGRHAVVGGGRHGYRRRGCRSRVGGSPSCGRRSVCGGWATVSGSSSASDRVEDGTGLPSPALFDEVVGQPGAVSQLIFAARRPVHAYLLHGPPGSGKRAAARALAAALLCPNGRVQSVQYLPACPGRHPSRPGDGGANRRLARCRRSPLDRRTGAAATAGSGTPGVGGGRRPPGRQGCAGSAEDG